MEVLVLTIFVSLVLVVAAGLFFAWNVSQRSHEQSDRLVLLPLADEQTAASPSPSTPSSRQPSTRASTPSPRERT